MICILKKINSALEVTTDCSVRNIYSRIMNNNLCIVTSSKSIQKHVYGTIVVSSLRYVCINFSQNFIFIKFREIFVRCNVFSEFWVQTKCFAKQFAIQWPSPRILLMLKPSYSSLHLFRKGSSSLIFKTFPLLSITSVMIQSLSESFDSISIK